MMRKLLSILTAMSMLLLVTPTFADTEQVKIGVVDIHKVMQQAPQVKKIQERLNKQFKSRQKAISKLEQSLKANSTKLERESTVLTASEKSKLQADIMKERREYERLVQDYQQDFGMAQNKEMQAFFQTLKQTVEAVAKAKKYDLILQKEAAPYAASRVEVTKLVLDKLG